MLIIHRRELAQKLWDADIALYNEKKSKRGKADSEFVSNMLKNGTLTDKVSALTLLVQESPVHEFAAFKDRLMGMVTKVSKREVLLALESIQDLLLNTLLPDRKLKFFINQPVGSEKATNAHLVSWIFEDSLKKCYHNFLGVLEKLLKNDLPHIKAKALSCVFELLTAKPEQEANLLALLVNKMVTFN
jgi:ribosome biogenesis protein MAK21